MYKTSFGIKNFTKNQANPFNNIDTDYIVKSNTVQINKEHLSKVFSLSRTGLKLLLYFINNYNQYNNTVSFNLKESEMYLGFSNKRSIYNALIELLGEKIIARTNNENLYYINSQIINLICKK